MKLKSSTLLLAFGSALFLSVSCSNDVKEGALSDSAKDSLTVTGIKIKDQNFMVPSPMILAEMIKKSGALYDKKMMNPVASLSNYSVGFKQGLNLGVYGADLGYVTMYENTGDAMEYYKTVVQLGNTLKITGSFDDKLMKRFNANVGRKDSILSLVGEAYRRSDKFLREGDQDDFAALILAGGWIESTWFALKIYKVKPNENVAVRIGEQKSTASGILKVLVNLNKPELEALIKLFSELNDVYQTVEINYSFTEPTTDEGKHLTTINGTTDVKITPEQLTELTAKVTAVRNFIIN
jgi:hypothetical protein